MGNPPRLRPYKPLNGILQVASKPSVNQPLSIDIGVLLFTKTVENKNMNEIPIKINDTGRVKKMAKLPLEMTNERLREVSNRGPKTKPKTIGARSKSVFLAR